VVGEYGGELGSYFGEVCKLANLGCSSVRWVEYGGELGSYFGEVLRYKAHTSKKRQ
jgi:hypothetical protein